MTPDLAATLLSALRERRPLVHNITNFVAMDLSANSLLAIGASPAMVHAEEEAADFAAIADSLVINIGTLSPPWVAAMRAAADAALAAGKPWVLDPVAVGATAYRTATAGDLCARRPTVIRANASEILALDQQGGATRGVDSLHAAEQAREAARRLARTTGAVVAVTGAVDYVSDGERMVAIENGDPMMSRVTATGCAVSAIVAAFLPVADDPLAATVAALAAFGVAGERAADGCDGPGSFRARLVDALYRLTPETLARSARIR